MRAPMRDWTIHHRSLNGRERRSMKYDTSSSRGLITCMSSRKDELLAKKARLGRAQEATRIKTRPIDFEPPEHWRRGKKKVPHVLSE